MNHYQKELILLHNSASIEELNNIRRQMLDCQADRHEVKEFEYAHI